MFLHPRPHFFWFKIIHEIPTSKRLFFEYQSGIGYDKSRAPAADDTTLIKPVDDFNTSIDHLPVSTDNRAFLNKTAVLKIKCSISRFFITLSSHFNVFLQKKFKNDVQIKIFVL